MAELFIQRRRLIKLIKRAVYFDALKALLAQFQKFFAVLAFSVADDRRQKITTGALFHCHDAVDHVLDLLCFNGQSRRG